MDNAITSLMDLIIPALGALLSDLRTWLTVAVMLGPILLLVMGLLYFFLPPKEANHKFGYRTYFGMGSIQAWRFTQWVAGLVWGVLGIGLTVAMVIVCIVNGGSSVDAFSAVALICLLVQAGLVLAGWLGIEITVAICYDKDGRARK